ncbi:hypothetical protein DFH07DRAFT_535175 [Mycena maculata]|uniref:DUF4211 domain-containing protein n=1 Tax=Mycena maculata TaxID=230809 RepID=A0AAD7NWA8_9AGAR|nr:hypothetical protein DFH07DRAFT_535175 [Mycena maculata]
MINPTAFVTYFHLIKYSGLTPMAPSKRKRTANPAAESPPLKKKARRVATKTQSIVEVQESDHNADDILNPVMRKKRRVAKSHREDSDRLKPSPSPKTAKKARRVKSPSPAPFLDSDADSDGGSGAVASPPKRRATRKIEVPSDSDEEEATAARKRLRRVKSSPVDAESDSDTNAPRKGRLRRKSDSEEGVEEPAKDDLVLESDDDPEDLALPVQPTSSKPTRKQLNASALERYAKARKNKSSPAPVPAGAAHEDKEEDMWREFTPIPEVEDDEEEEEEDGEELEMENPEESFIVEENDGDADADADAALDLMRYATRELDEHFAVFVEYIIALSDPEYLSTATADEKEYFETAVTALKRHIGPLADSMTLSTWKAPFIATLNLRPRLRDGVSCEGSGDCHACWTRGMYSCDLGGSYTLSTHKGIYDPNTFQDLPEKKIKYGKATQFENNAEARSLPYPPRFELIIGKRCFNRALAYHDARHYLYGVSVRVKEKINSLCEDDPNLEEDPNALLQAMKEEDFITKLWGQFMSDRKQWAQWGNRKDRDMLV